MKLSLRSLEGFREIIRMGSVTAAAKRLGLSQPAVSRLLAQLEQELGFAIFHREKGRLVPTPQAMLLFEEVDLAFVGLDRIASLAANMQQLDAGHLRVVAVPSFAEGPLVGIIAGFMESRPKVQLSLDSRSRPSIINLVSTRSVDCGFGKLPVEHPGITVRPLQVATTVCAVPEGHRLADKRSLGAGDLDGEPLILIGRGGETRMRIEEAFREARVRPSIRLETHHVGAACAFSGAGVGIALVSDLLAQRYVDTGIVLVPFRPKILQEYVFMTPAGVGETRLADAFYDHCREAMKGGPGRRAVERKRKVRDAATTER
ncbi:MAG: LysR family transcriptional regulator [Gammaproteobacteria bacterium]|nr:MAG: LysR family transcriptional regulator [Gammaproteobacteria bacterium]